MYLRPPRQLIQLLRRHDRFLIFGHLEPDGDCVASQLALEEFLRRRGKRAVSFSAGPFDRPETEEFRGRFRSQLRPEDLEGEPLAVVLDCSTPERLGTLAEAVAGLPTVVIDHHASGTVFGRVRWVVPQAPATSLMVQRLIERLAGRPTASEAELLLFGLATDTGFFRHLEEDSSPAFAAVARLAAAGASPRSVHQRVHGGWSLGKVHQLGRTLLGSRLEFGGRVLVATQPAADTAAGAGRGSDEVYQILQCVRGVEIVALVKEEAGGRCSVGLRSAGSLDVGALAADLGGGGHRRAAGYGRPGSIAEVEAQLLAELSSRFFSV
ncbi:MAG: DHH family phosphoesterase [Spirochaetales bacterium]|nr:DHH family phosphoesterase [Spirochaetales bacterium]